MTNIKAISRTILSCAAAMTAAISVASADPGHHRSADGTDDRADMQSVARAADRDHASGHDEAGHGHVLDFGAPGKASEVTRTIRIEIVDNRYSLENISVKRGETIRFILHNKGELVHEFNIGTAAMHTAHQEQMMAMVDHGVLEADKINYQRMKMDMGGGKTMEHNDPNSVLLEPGKSGEVVWKFTKAADLEFACNVPGHYDAGMVGQLHVN